MTKIKSVLEIFFNQSNYHRLKTNCCIFLFYLCQMLFTISLNAQAGISPEVQKAVSASFTESGESPDVIAKKFAAAISKLNAPADKLQALTILATYAETNYLFAEAASYYSQAALIAAEPKTAQALNLKAARSYFLSGDSQLGVYILNTIIAQAADIPTKTQAEVYLLLAGLDDESKLAENIAALRKYSADANATLLFTLYWLTGDATVKNRLLKEFPASMDAEIVQTKATLSLIAFWYLMPRKKNADAANSASAKTPETAGASGKLAATTAGQKTSEKPKYYQVGFFKTKEYAENLAAELVAKGFPAQVKTETKNGSTAFYVIVNETGDSVSISDKLRNAGYECYPVF